MAGGPADAMTKTFLFDLDMTLVDTSALATLRKTQQWHLVAANMHLVRAFRALPGGVAPHEMPAALSMAGHRVGIVTSSPRPYAEEITRLFRIPYDVLVCYEDTADHKPDPAPLLKALSRLGVAAGADVHYVGDDVGDVEASYHAGIVSVGVGWSPTSPFEFSSAAPDIFVGRPSTLLRTDRLGSLPYVGESLAAGRPYYGHWGSILRCDDGPGVYALGRYFTTSDPRHAGSRLSEAVLRLKEDDGPAEALGRALGKAVDRLDWTPDIVVPVPPKPSQARNRFAALLGVAAPHKPDEVAVERDGLRCTREVEGYKALGPLERREAVKGAFESEFTWGRAKILLVDDVYTTGGTTAACAEALLGDGASEVRIMALAKDQRTFARKVCPACGRTMRVRISGVGVKFWGCSGYPDACRNTEDL